MWYEVHDFMDFIGAVVLITVILALPTLFISGALSLTWAWIFNIDMSSPRAQLPHMPWFMLFSYFSLIYLILKKTK